MITAIGVILLLASILWRCWAIGGVDGCEMADKMMIAGACLLIFRMVQYVAKGTL